MIHDLGELLVLLYLCPKDTWARIAPIYPEVLVRNVRWNIDKDKSLALLEPAGGSAWTTGCKLRSDAVVLLFGSVCFRPSSCSMLANCQQVAYRRWLRLPQPVVRPRPGTAVKYAACVDILGVGARNAKNRLSWGKFFAGWHYRTTDVALSERLRAAVVTSELRGYHQCLDGYEMEEAIYTRYS